MIIGITGASGFIGSTIEKEAMSLGDQVISFSRSASTKDEAHVDQQQLYATPTRLFSLEKPLLVEGCQAMIHLAGAPILGLWTKSKKKKILESRILGTRRVVEGIRDAKKRPEVLVSASGIGIYGDQGDIFLEESSPAGKGFLAEVAQAWEKEALEATRYGVRVVLLRIGLVLGKEGGMLPLIRPIFASGLGAALGSGKQWLSPIHVSDAARLALYACHHPTVKGPLNAVLPEPLTNRTFTQLLAKSLNRSALPPFLSAPSWGLKLLLGELSCLLLESQRVVPAQALESGFSFSYPSVKAALEESLR